MQVTRESRPTFPYSYLLDSVIAELNKLTLLVEVLIRSDRHILKHFLPPYVRITVKRSFKQRISRLVQRPVTLFKLNYLFEPGQCLKWLLFDTLVSMLFIYYGDTFIVIPH